MNVPAQASAQMFASVWKLLRLRWQITFNSFKHAKTSRKVWTVIGLLALLAFIGFIFWLSFLLLGFLRSPKLTKYVGLDVLPFLQAIPALIFTTMFLVIFVTSFGVLLQALYLSGDMDFLLTAPVPIRAVFITKLLQAVLPTFGLAAVFVLPVLFGLGFSGGYNLLYYPLVVLLMVALTLASAGLSALLVMAIVRIFPARRVAEVLGFVGAVTSMICSQTGNLSRILRTIGWTGQPGNALERSLDAAQLGRARSGGIRRRPLADGIFTGGAHAGVGCGGFLVCAGDCRALVLYRLGQDAGHHQQEKTGCVEHCKQTLTAGGFE
jgi:hypothetical protein